MRHPFLAMRTLCQQLLWISFAAVALPANASATADCPALSSAPLTAPFGPGETLHFALDIYGVRAGAATARVLASRGAMLPVDFKAETNGFFSALHRVEAHARTLLHQAGLRPTRYEETSIEAGARRSSTASFDAGGRRVHVRYDLPSRSGTTQYDHGPDGFDALSTVYALRALPLAVGQSLCLDVYSVRRMWRLTGRVVGRERHAVPSGEFTAWHIAGEATSRKHRREIHLWISDDKKRLPLSLTGSGEGGGLRATLVSFENAGPKMNASR
ncbi:MAG: DUF3108 domain-containing protein [Myxococcaceae bacterium]